MFISSPIMLFLPQQQIDDPASPNMRAIAPAMGDQLLVVAFGVHQGIGKNRHAVEGFLGIDGLGKINDGERFPTRVDGERLKRIAENVVDQGTLKLTFFFSFCIANECFRSLSQLRLLACKLEFGSSGRSVLL